MAPEPVADGRNAAIESFRDLLERQACVRQRGQLLLRQPAPRREPIRVDCSEAMSLYPIANRPGWSADAASDLLERQSLFQKTLQQLPIHHPSLPVWPDGKYERVFG
jgi:hypothetical protein